MNRKYLIEKISAMCESHLNARVAALGRPPKADWTPAEKHKMISTGKAKIKKLTEIAKKWGHNADWDDAFTFPAHPHAALVKAYEAKVSVLREKTKKAESDAIDSAMLARDGLAAIAALRMTLARI